MSPIRILGAVALATLIGAPMLAFAQDEGAANDRAREEEARARQSATPAEREGAPTSGVVLLSSPTPPELASKLKAGDPTVISNQPIADTPENRARYGQPMSNAGRHTAPVGD